MSLTDTSPDLPADDVRRDLDHLSDAELVAAMAARLAVPRRDPADSFVLHAPLELVARAALLPFVQPDRRADARVHFVAVADGFERPGPPMVTPRAAEFASLAEATARLVAAIDRGELDDIDAAARWLGHAASAIELQRSLAATLAPRLAAAAHASIFLYQLPRVAPRGEVTGELLRGLCREVGRNPGWRLHWLDEPPPTGAEPASPDDLFRAIAATPRLGAPSDTFIFPLMSHVDTQGIAAANLAPVTGPGEVAARGRAVLRAAAWSMLLEPGEHAPYGWSHALTLPQAVLGVGVGVGVGVGDIATERRTALAIAATYVVGFRSALAVRPLTPRVPDRIAASWRDALDGDPATAAAAVWHAPDDAGPEIVRALATRASTQSDAHLVKYTLACLDAAADDPSHTRLFLAAAASLSAWWAASIDPDDPLTSGTT